MGSIGQSASASLPTLGFKEQSSPQPFGNYGTSSIFAPSGQHSMEAGAGYQSQPEPQQRAGRKRSRDEAGINLEDNDLFRQADSASLELGQNAGYSEGTTLFGPNGSLDDSGSEKRSCADDAAAYSLPVAPPLTAPMPILRSHKSQRLDMGNTSKTEEGNGWNVNTPSSSPTRQSPKRGPTVDDYTVHLGIGWSRISNDVDMQAAARGWAKYIENHFHITSPKILLQSNGLASYLVEAKEGWFLFGEDLAQGRLVATSLDRTFENLRTSPPVFDGTEVLVPVAAEAAKPAVNATAEDMVDEPHIYAGSMNRRKEYLSNSGMMGADAAASHSINRQDPDDGMDMS